MKYYIALILALTSLIALGNGKKTPPASVSFHLQGSPAEAPKFARKVKTLAGEYYFRKVPEISSRDIVAFSPFPADDKKTYGLVFKINNQAARRLQATTSMNQGKLLLSLVNGQAVGVVRIDKPVKDGMLVIWGGISQQELKMYDMIAPRIGESKKEWKKRLKELKKKKKK